MDNHSSFLIHYQYIIIFINDIDRNILRNDNIFARRMSEKNRNLVVRFYSIVLFYRNSIDYHITSTASLRNLISGGILSKNQQKFVYPERFLIFIYNDIEMLIQIAPFLQRFIENLIFYKIFIFFYHRIFSTLLLLFSVLVFQLV